MLKKLISYQRLLLNSTPPFDMNSKKPLEIVLYTFSIFTVVFMTIYLFAGDVIFSNINLFIITPAVSIWMINRILNGSNRLFQTVPVSRKYIVFNVFLLSIVIIFIGYLIYWFSVIGLIGIIFGIAYLVNPNSITSPPETAASQMINTTKGDIFMICVFAIIIFVGVAITFINAKKLRTISFAVFATIGYGLLFLFKLSMPIYQNSGKVEFIKSISIMPQVNIILLCLAFTTVIICIISVLTGYSLYVNKSNSTK